MTSAQRQRPRRSGQSGPDPASRGFILVIVAVVLGAILLAAGGNVGFDEDDESVDISDDGSEVTATTAAPVETTAAPAATVPPADVSVVVANGAGIGGLAGETTDFLATQGYSTTTATDAPSNVSATVVYFAEGFQANAASIAGLFSLPQSQVQPLPAEPVANDQPQDAAIVVVVGPDAEAVVTGTRTEGGTGAGGADTGDTTGETTTTTQATTATDEG